MSGSAPQIPEELDILAGEYVLGALDETEMRAVRRRARIDPALAGAIAAWERRLMPLAGAVPPEAPPPALWNRLEDAIAAVPAGTDPEPERSNTEVVRIAMAQRSQPRRPAVWPWQLTTVASLALAAGIAAVAFLPQVAQYLHLAPEPPRFAALVPTDGKGPGFLAQARPDGTVVLTALAAVSVPAGRDLELWILRPDMKAPASLGVLPAGGKRVTLPALPPGGTKLLVTLEPQGGSPSGAPTGPLVYGGALGEISL